MALFKMIKRLGLIQSVKIFKLEIKFKYIYMHGAVRTRFFLKFIKLKRFIRFIDLQTIQDSKDILNNNGQNSKICR